MQIKIHEEPKTYTTSLKHCSLFATDEWTWPRKDQHTQQRLLKLPEQFQQKKNFKNETEHVRTEVILDGVFQICTKISKKNGTKERNI